MKPPKLKDMFFCVAFGAFVNEGTGYTLFNADNGDNIFCNVDPACRKLTDKEIELFSEYYGQSINYRQINYFERPRFGISFGYAAAASFNGIFEDIQTTDRYKNKGERNTALLEAIKIHEVGHIWQYQRSNFITYLANGVYTGVNNTITIILSNDFESDTYDIDLNKIENWSDLTIEQEAEVAFDIHFLKYKINYGINHITDPSELDRVRNWCHELKALEYFAAPHLPIKKTQCPLNIDVS